ncbi:1-acyl-sn-glycerol-3-phosphate acyltransferase [Echinicola jeungdonensis]|uniref:1-acyl-sn-glycerol-3-phosphate acyltransferase n=1 Tax=Echinicola jeungdonensis TaxID=709343 RepID=A0ABV5J673_9BACT|nr:1-acyl-sn-glycerol-3-phosphate acyltransferase [Echinicola jeungdonensis]MDN3670986.1 1-acyl-sn-glycerol-3-phosphate acyltransferase [Echinicola jeungdonensis]
MWGTQNKPELKEPENKFIEIRKVIQDKNPKLLKWIPKFVLNYIRKIAHEDDLNNIMKKWGHLHGLEFVDALIQEFGVEVELKGEENIPMDRSVIFASNHPLGGLDGIAFMHALGKYRKDLRFLVNDILTLIKNFEPLFVPVNKHGAHGRAAAKTIEETYAGDYAVLIFPSGLVSRKQEGDIKDLDWKKSFINKAKKYKKDVVPVYIEGKNSNFFYNLAMIRKKIGIEANVEMFYLADEMFAQKNKKVTIHVGKPISYNYFDSSKSEKDWAEEVKNKVYSIASEL